MQKKTWIAVGATSVLGFGLLAGGASAAANVMTLTEAGTGAAVPGLSDVGADKKGSGASADVNFSVQSDSIGSPSPVSMASPASQASPASMPSPASQASSTSPASEQTPALPMSEQSPVSPVSGQSPASPVSVQSPAEGGSVD